MRKEKSACSVVVLLGEWVAGSPSIPVCPDEPKDFGNDQVMVRLHSDAPLDHTAPGAAQEATLPWDTWSPS